MSGFEKSLGFGQRTFSGRVFAQATFAASMMDGLASVETYDQRPREFQVTRTVDADVGCVVVSDCCVVGSVVCVTQAVPFQTSPEPQVGVVAVDVLATHAVPFHAVPLGHVVLPLVVVVLLVPAPPLDVPLDAFRTPPHSAVEYSGCAASKQFDRGKHWPVSMSMYCVVKSHCCTVLVTHDVPSHTVPAGQFVAIGTHIKPLYTYPDGHVVVGVVWLTDAGH